MDDKKTTLYLALLCVILIIWGSVLDGKRMHTKEVLEAEKAELLSTLDKTSAEYNEAKARQADLSRKLTQLQQKLKEVKAENAELRELNKKLEAELETQKADAEKRAASDQAKASDSGQVSAASPAPAATPLLDSRLRDLESKVDRLVHEWNEARSRNAGNQQNAFAVSELQNSLNACRERVSRYQQDAGEAAMLRSRIRQLEWELSSRTQELWNTRLSMSADLDACTRRLMEASMPKPGQVMPAPRNLRHAEAGQSAKAEACQCRGQKQNQDCKNCKKAGDKSQACKCQNCPRIKKLRKKLLAYSSRIEALQQQLYSSNLQSLKEIEELKRALKEKNDQCLRLLGAKANNAQPAASHAEQTKQLSEELQSRQKKLSEVSAELEQYKKNTEALLEQIREQRAEIRRLKEAQK